MSKKPPLPKLCMFCGKDDSFGPMTKEHFGFKALWNDRRPDKTKTVWAHKDCNKSFSDDNDYVRDILAMEAGASKHPEVKKLHEGKLKRKLEKRPGAFVKTLKNLRLIPQFTPNGIWVGNAPTFEVDWPRVERVIKNVAKGVYFETNRIPMPDDFLIEVITIGTEQLAAEVKPMIDQMVPWQGFGDDVFLCRYINSPNRRRMNCLMQFYRHRFFYVEAISKALLEEIQERKENGASRSDEI